MHVHGLMRLAGWGVAATAALLLVVIAANSNGGRERLLSTFGGGSARAAEAAQAEAAQAVQAAQLARLAATEADTRRLIEIVRSLASDRERLMTRLSAIERSLEEVTGSIQKQAAAPAAPPPPSPAAAAEPPPKTAAAPPQTVPPAEPTAVPSPAEPPTRVANMPPPGGAVPDLEAIPARPAAGVDVGGARDFDGLRTLWNTLTTNHSDLFEGLNPIVAVRENSKSRAADLRLIAGPLPDVDLANRICTTLSAAKRYCRLAPFEGQALALNDPSRRPVAKSRPTVRATP